MTATCPDHEGEPATKTCARCGRFLCERCAVGADRTRCIACERLVPVPPRAIGGWLIVAFLTLFAPSCMLVSQAIPAYISVKNAGVEAVLNDHGWLLLNGWNLGTLAALAALSLYLIPQFLMRKRRVPKLMIVLFASSFALGIVNGIITAVNQPTLAPNGGSNQMWPVLFRLTVLGFWIRYFQGGERVKETFIRD